MFNKICINEEMLPTYTDFYINHCKQEKNH